MPRLPTPPAVRIGAGRQAARLGLAASPGNAHHRSVADHNSRAVGPVRRGKWGTNQAVIRRRNGATVSSESTNTGGVPISLRAAELAVTTARALGHTVRQLRDLAAQAAELVGAGSPSQDSAEATEVKPLPLGKASTSKRTATAQVLEE